MQRMRKSKLALSKLNDVELFHYIKLIDSNFIDHNPNRMTSATFTRAFHFAMYFEGDTQTPPQREHNEQNRQPSDLFVCPFQMHFFSDRRRYII